SPAAQKEILAALLEAASGVVPRTILFIRRADTLHAWAVRWRDSAGGDAAMRASHMTLPARGDHLPARAVAAAATCVAGPEGPGFVMTERLGGPTPAHATAVPILVRGRVVALLYGDAGAGRGPSGEPTLSILGRAAGLVLESFSASRRPRTAIPGNVAAAGRLRVEVGAPNPVTTIRGAEPRAPRGSASVAAPAGGELWDDGLMADTPGPAPIAV